jgi:hypothetical protein
VIGVHVGAGLRVPDVRRHLLVGVKLGGPKAGYHRMAQPHRPLAIDASVAYGCATFFDLTLTPTARRGVPLQPDSVFVIFIIVLALAAVINIFQPPAGGAEQRLPSGGTSSARPSWS